MKKKTLLFLRKPSNRVRNPAAYLLFEDGGLIQAESLPFVIELE